MTSDSPPRQVPLAAVCEIYDGPHATPRKTGSGPLFLSISSLDGGTLDLSQSSHLSEHDFLKWTRRVTPQAGDVVFSYETRLGEAALIPEGLRCCLGRRMGLLRPKRDDLLPEFLLYAYLAPEFQEVIRQRTVPGSTVDRLLLKEIGSFPIRVPDVRRQRAVVDVLGPLDSLVRNLKARVDLLQGLSTALVSSAHYAALADNDGSSRALKDCAEWLSGGTPRTKAEAYWGGDIPWLSAKSLTEFYAHRSNRNVTDLGAKNGTRVVNAGTLLLLVRGMSLKTEIRHAVAVRPVAFSQDVKALVPVSGVDPWYLGYAIRARETDLLSLVDEAGHGTGRLPTDRLEDFEIWFPAESTYRNLVGVLHALNDDAVSLLKQAGTLTQLRNTLLPKLISGELPIEEATAQVGEVA